MEPKESGSGGGTTPFHSMSHEEMLAWLDQASSVQVQAAADRLSSAYVEIGKIAQQLKFRPERVEWKGEGFQAFVEWGESLASATQRLADYSQSASEWMSRAAEDIATTQKAIPRYTSKEQASANLEAAKSAPNDTDSKTVAANATAALAATEEKNRVEAADMMRELAGSYKTSYVEIGKLEVPTFQPPPDQFVPDGGRVSGGGSQDLARSGSDGSSSSAERAYAPAQERTVARDEVSQARVDTGAGTGGISAGASRPVEGPVDMGIDSVATLPDPAPTAPPGTPGPPTSRPDGLGPVTPGPVLPGRIPPTFGGNPAVPNTGGPGGKTPQGGRSVVPSGQAGTNPRMPRESGIAGGRPVPPSTGRSTGGIPRGTVVGNEATTARGPMGRGGMPGMPGMPGGGPMGGASQGGISGGRRLGSEMGGIVGGRPQQPGQNSARPFTPGGSGLVRGVDPSSTGGANAGQAGRTGAVPPGSQGANSRRDDRNGERPDYLSEDEETWQQGNRRVVPPVID
ncbi:hypothetical protein OG883_26905 [Streptomyces sp. NBC_01142]|uniref:WXG100 family type VII secretion target n=1 Tax=Streptomyces sp. NBC_01142 TaxID=2975865 RepID=UPI0022546D58|nr:hypothetical protein [Streptomyces sp. NBC_01142]MCX4823444.1 hypothetical protein [Streptomyces sp. NBC_01142]